MCVRVLALATAIYLQNCKVFLFTLLYGSFSVSFGMTWSILSMTQEMLYAMLHFVFFNSHNRNRIIFCYYFSRIPIPQSVNLSIRAWKLNVPKHFSRFNKYSIRWLIYTFEFRKRIGKYISLPNFINILYSSYLFLKCNNVQRNKSASLFTVICENVIQFRLW